LPADIGAHVTVRMPLNHISGIGNYTNALLDSEPHPIDLATQEFILAVHCPEPVAGTTRAAPPMPMPGVTALSWASPHTPERAPQQRPGR